MARTVWRDRQRLLLVLALIAGVLGMHALVLPPHGGSDHAAMSTSTITAAADSGRAATAIVTSAIAAGNAMSDPAGSSNVGRSDTMPMPPGAIHDIMHLCLAILAALAMVLVATFIVMTAVAAPLPGLPSRISDTTPGRPPPRSAVRLALLSVLRN